MTYRQKAGSFDLGDVKELMASTCKGDTFAEKVLSDPYPPGAPRLFVPR